MTEQLALIEAESDEALLLPHSELAKRYTATQVQKVQWRVDCILTLLACNLPLELVAERAHVNERTVKELGAMHAAKIAGDMMRFSDYAGQFSAKMMWLAERRAADAPFKELVAASSFIGKLSLDMKLAASLGASPEEPSMDVETESEGLRQLREGLKRLKQGNGNGRELTRINANE